MKMSSISAFDNGSSEGTFKLPRVTSYQTPQSIDPQAIVPSNHRRETGGIYSSDFQRQVMPPWTNFLMSTSLTFPDEEKHGAASEYCWVHSPFHLHPSSLQTDSSTSEYSNDSILPGHSEERTTPKSENEALHESGNRRSVDLSRVVHNQVEQRYRHRVRDNINALWISLPESQKISKPSKAVILHSAREHILALKQEARRKDQNVEVLEAKVRMYEEILEAFPYLNVQNVKYPAV